MRENENALSPLEDQISPEALLSSGRLQEIEARVTTADAGPWVYDDTPDGRACGYIRQGERRPPPWPGIARASRLAGLRTSGNGQFIAHARQDIPDLLAEVVRLRRYLLAFGTHTDACPASSVPGEDACTCGFGLLIRQIDLGTNGKGAHT